MVPGFIARSRVLATNAIVSSLLTDPPWVLPPTYTFAGAFGGTISNWSVSQSSRRGWRQIHGGVGCCRYDCLSFCLPLNKYNAQKLEIPMTYLTRKELVACGGWVFRMQLLRRALYEVAGGVSLSCLWGIPEHSVPLPAGYDSREEHGGSV